MSVSKEKPNQPESFESALAELEQLVRKMDQPDAQLEAMLADYRRGAELVKFCRARLTLVREEVAQIDQSLGQGDAV